MTPLSISVTSACLHTCDCGGCDFCRGTEGIQAEKDPGGAEGSVGPKENLEIKEPQERLYD